MRVFLRNILIIAVIIFAIDRIAGNHQKFSHIISLIVIFTLFPLISSGITSCNDDDEDLYNIEKIDVHYESDSLRVLVLGNSFSYDGIRYLEEIASATRIDKKRFCIYHGFIGSGGFQDWIDAYNSGDTISFTKMAGRIDMQDRAPISTILKQPWEVCIILQGSHESYKWESFEHSTDHLISLIKSQATNPQIKIAYVMPWSHTTVNTPTELPGNIICTWKLLNEHHVDFIIPVGIAIQNAREAHMDNGKYLTRDDWHICFGTGRYIAACTWYESLLEPFFHVSMLGCDALHTLAPNELEDPTTMPVTEGNRKLCQQCAFYAIQSPLKVTKRLGK